MADAKKLRSDIQKLKKALQAKGVSKTVKDKLQGQLDKAESELAASKKPAKATKAAKTKKASTPLSRLQGLIKKKKYSAYSKAGVDLKKDAGQPALPTGKRTSKSGKTYYEYRANRIDVKQPPKRYPKLEDGGETAKFEVDDVVYHKGHNTVGIVRIGEERGEVKTDADGNVDVSELEYYNPLKHEAHKNAKVAPSTFKEIEERMLWKPFSERTSQLEKGGYMARGGYVSKGELVWRKLSNVDRTNFLKENFTPEITPMSQNSLVGKDFNFLPKKVKIKLEAKYANVDDYADGGGIPEGYHQMPDGTIMADSAHMADGGETHLNISDDERMEIKNLKGLIEESMEAIESHEKLAEKSDDKETKSYHENKVKKHKEVLANRKSRLEQLTKRRMADGGETEKMALGGATVSTQYEKLEGTDYELKIKVYYDKGGISYATYKQEPRGYYLSVSPVQREKRDGYTVESYMAFSGVKTLLLPVQRQSPKAEKQAQEIAEKMMPEMKSYISDKVKEKAGFMKGGGYMAEGGMIKVEEDAYGKSAYIPYKGETFLLEWNTERPTKASTVISDRSFRRLDEDSSLYEHLLVTLLKAMHENKVQYAEEGAKLAKGSYMAEGGVMSTTHRLSK